MEINTKDLDTLSDSMLSQANALVINNDEDLKVAGAFVVRITAHIKNIKATFLKSKKKTDEAHKEVVALEKKALGGAEELREIAKGKLSEYATKQEAIEAARAAKLAAELKEQAEKDALEMAENLEKNDQHAEADLALEVAAAPVQIPIRKAVKVEGISYKDVTKFEITEDDLLPRNCTSGDKRKIKAQIDAGVKVIPGVRIWNDKTVVARA